MKDFLFSESADTDVINVVPTTPAAKKLLFGDAESIALSADFDFAGAQRFCRAARQLGLSCELPPSLDAEFAGLDENAQPAFSDDELRPCFERVQNPDHWKGPIDCVIEEYDDRELEKIKAAVYFFTATSATIEKIGKGQFRVMAPGYWAGPAN